MFNHRNIWAWLALPNCLKNLFYLFTFIIQVHLSMIGLAKLQWQAGKLGYSLALTPARGKLIVMPKFNVVQNIWTGTDNKCTSNILFCLAFFLGPRGPLRTPLVPVRCCPVPSSATKIHATSPYSFSDSKLILFHIQTLSSRNLSHSTQYTEHWTGSSRGPF